MDQSSVVQEPAPLVNPNAKWYILQSHAGYEYHVEKTINEKLRIARIGHLVEQLFIPSEEVIQTKGGKKRSVNRRYFPGYILIKADLQPELWHLLMGITRISGFVGGTQKDPLPIDEKEFQSICSQIDSGVQQAAEKVYYEIGQKVLITEGSFANFSGVIDEINQEKKKLKVLVSIFGRPTPVEVAFDKIKTE